MQSKRGGFAFDKREIGREVEARIGGKKGEVQVLAPTVEAMEYPKGRAPVKGRLGEMESEGYKTLYQLPVIDLEMGRKLLRDR